MIVASLLFLRGSLLYLYQVYSTYQGPFIIEPFCEPFLNPQRDMGGCQN